jgi:plastocyanin/FtsP/CotA-like multicopper oxidase with cupredoxin domain
MATLDIWIQLEAQPWDVCPRSSIDRATAEGLIPVLSQKQAFLRSPSTGKTRTAIVNAPMPGGALILRRYTDGWRVPVDRKVNPWDLNEPNPTDTGTMGTIPGAVIECDVGDTVRVHFRNMDFRAKNPPPPWEHPANVEALPVEYRTHSLHAHGLVFAREHDGAYPLAPPDRSQPVDANEIINWNFVGVKRFKQGDRVPPACTFIYTWEARWPTSAGVWFYHDHSICHHENTARGAIGMIVVHNPADTENEVDITPARLPDGSWVGTPIGLSCYRADMIPLLPYALALLGKVEGAGDHVGGGDHIGPGDHLGAGDAMPAAHLATAHFGEAIHEPEDPGAMHTLSDEHVIRWGGLSLELTEHFTHVKRICFDVYRDPPDQALFLLLFHEMAGVGMCINGRKYLGNTPTLLAGPKTRMRFGVVGMGDAFHTFHIHGHRWVIPGPAGTKHATIEASAQVQATTQFEDAKVFGPASSFAFTLEEGNGMMRADPPIGEWHMHCHVGHHMMDGMVGSLLIVNGGELALPLPIGKACPPQVEPEPPEAPSPPPTPPAPRPTTHDVNMYDYSGDHNFPHYKPGTVSIYAGDTVRWTNRGRQQHTATPNAGAWSCPTLQPGQSHSVAFPHVGDFWYHCNLHSADAPTYAFGRVWVDPRPGAVTPPTGSPPAAGPTTHQVQISSTGFSPSTITIKAGDTVNWTNQDSFAHTVAGDDHSWTTPMLTSGKSFSRVFSSPGTIPYHCHIHPEMTATIQVTA